MFTMNKNAYMIPETEIMPLESMLTLMSESTKFGFGNGDGNNGNFHAPARMDDLF